MNSIIPLQNSPERVSLLPIAPGVDFGTVRNWLKQAEPGTSVPEVCRKPGSVWGVMTMCRPGGVVCVAA